METTTSVLSQYGETAFGLIAMVILWKLIIEPQLKNNKLDHSELMRRSELMASSAESLSAMSTNIRESSKQMVETSRVLEVSSRTINSSTDRIITLLERLDRYEERHKDSGSIGLD